MKVRGVRGATTSDSNSREDILLAAHDLITGIIEANEIVVDDVASILFSTFLASRKPINFAVVPIICITPFAPEYEFAFGLNLLS